MIVDIITLLRSHHFRGAGQFTEIAKGQNEITTRKNFTEKIKRQWLSLRKLM